MYYRPSDDSACSAAIAALTFLASSSKSIAASTCSCNLSSMRSRLSLQTTVPGSCISAYFKQFEQNVESFISVKEQTTPQKACYYDTKSNVVAPHQWLYENERTMNGGILFGNVSGYDTLHSDYSSYDTLGKYGCNKETFDHSSKKDDIRFGLGIPNQYYRDTN